MLHKQEALGERRERKCANGSIENFFSFFISNKPTRERERSKAGLRNGAIRMLMAAGVGGSAL